MQLIQIVPQELSSPEMTGRWELALDQITDGKQDADRFMDSIRKFSTFLVNFARNNRADVVFPDDGRRKKRAQSFVTRGTKIDGCVCPSAGRAACWKARRRSSAPARRTAATSPSGRTA